MAGAAAIRFGPHLCKVDTQFNDGAMWPCLTRDRRMLHNLSLSGHMHRSVHVKISPCALNACCAAAGFLSTRLSYGIVNLKPLVPGHVLLIPRRVVARLHELTPDEVCDLWLLATHVVGPRLERHYQAKALTVSVQDGAASGQTVPHAHIHILPRKGTQDFDRNPDAIYGALESDDVAHMPDPSKLNGEFRHAEPWRKPRTQEQMRDETTILRTLFPELEYQVPIDQGA